MTTTAAAPAPTTTVRQRPLTDPREAAEVLLSVARILQHNSHPKLALPTVAGNHHLTLHELMGFLEHHGYPNAQRLIHAARKIAGATTATAAPAAGNPHPRNEAGGIPKRPPVDEQRDPSTVTTPTSPTTSQTGPYVTALSADLLFADPAYQRDLDEARVARMVKAYDPALVGILEVSERRDPDTGDVLAYAVLDGQHRWALVKEIHFASDDTAPAAHLACRVHTGLTVDAEATLYHRLNTTRKQLTGWDRWKARRSAGDPVVTAIETTATNAGFTISYRNVRGHITATKACETVHSLGGPTLLAAVLDIIHTAWRDDPEAVTSGIIQGLAHVLTAYDVDEVDQDRLVEALTGIVPRQLNARAAAVREIQKGTIDKLTAHVIVEQYNQLRRAGQIPVFFDRVRPLSPNKGTKRAAEVARLAAIREWAIDRGLITSAPNAKITQAIRDDYDANHPEVAEG